MTGQVFRALETSRAVTANVRVSVHVDFRCWSMSVFGGLEVCWSEL